VLYVKLLSEVAELLVPFASNMLPLLFGEIEVNPAPCAPCGPVAPCAPVGPGPPFTPEVPAAP
jgi:hypothetical protein